MAQTAPNKLDLPPRDVVSRAEQTEINEVRGVRPGGAGIYSDITVVPLKRIAFEALREIVNLGGGLRRRRHHARADHDPAGPALHRRRGDGPDVGGRPSRRRLYAAV